MHTDPSIVDVVQVVRGRPSTDEVAVLVAVLTAAGAGGAPTAPAESTVSLWGSHERLVRAAVHPQPGGWRASALPG